MAVPKRPVVFDQDNAKMRQAIDGGEVIGGKFIQLSTDSGNMLEVSVKDGGLFVPAPEISDAGSLVSADRNNDLHTGSDGGLYVNVMDEVDISARDNVLSKETDGLLASIRIEYTTATGTLRLLGRGNAPLGSVVLPKHQILKSARLVENPGGQAPGTYIEMVFSLDSGSTDTVYLDVTKLVDVYTAADTSVEVSNYTIKAKLDPSGPLVAGVNGLTLTMSKLVSSDSNNLLKTGTDNRLYVDGSAVKLQKDSMMVTSMDSIPAELAVGGHLDHVY